MLSMGKSVELSDLEVALLRDLLFQKVDVLEDTYERARHRTRFRIKDKANVIRGILAKLGNSAP